MLKRIICTALILLCVIMPCGCGGTDNDERNTAADELRGVWISVFDIDYKNGDEQSFIRSFDSMMQNVRNIGCNAVFVHVRSHGDACYPSKLFPWSAYITGMQGESPGFDPLEIMIKLAHNHSLKFHAWINPFRVSSNGDISKLCDDNYAKKCLKSKDLSVSRQVKKAAGGIYYNPSNKAVRGHIIDGVTELVKNYDVDGVHIDDYFYPTTAADFDSEDYADYKKTTEQPLTLADFRRECVDETVSSIYSAVKAANKNIVFGISPQASVYYNYNSCYADVAKWCKSGGYTDYIAPQIYFGFDDERTDQNGMAFKFDGCAKYWNKLCGDKCKLYFGLGMYRSGEKIEGAGGGENEWCENDDIITRQVDYSRKLSNFGGFILFSYSSFTQNAIAKSETANLTQFLSERKSSGTVAKITAERAELLCGDSADDRSRPTCTYLLKGTLDYCYDREIVNFSGSQRGATLKKYRKLACGYRIYSSSGGESTSSVYSGSLPKSNSVRLQKYGIDERYTVLTFKVGYKAPFTVSFTPQSYASPDSSSPDYSITKAEYKYIDIKFYYAAVATNTVDLSDNPLFSEMRWMKSGNNYRLRLTLKKAGRFYGYSAYYNDDGELELQFLNPTKAEKSDNEYGVSLKNAVIMLDAGHGGKDCGANSNDGKTYESALNLTLANSLKNELEKTGARVIMTRSEDSDLSLADRAAKIYKYRPSLFISLHRDWSADNSQHGFDAYYFYPISKSAADSVFDSVKNVISTRKAKYYPFYVTRVTACPSVLLECGFMTNDGELKRLKSKEYTYKLAKAIVMGVCEYFKAN